MLRQIFMTAFKDSGGQSKSLNPLRIRLLNIEHSLAEEGFNSSIISRDSSIYVFLKRDEAGFFLPFLAMSNHYTHFREPMVIKSIQG